MDLIIHSIIILSGVCMVLCSLSGPHSYWSICDLLMGVIVRIISFAIGCVLIFFSIEPYISYFLALKG